VAAYIATAPPAVRGKLRTLRAAIRKAAPAAAESISYGMPFYSHKGRLAYFGFARKHIGLYIPTPVVAEHKSELRGFATAAATIRFPLDRALPVGLIGKLVRARVRMNDAGKGKS
jgi:uncharacterized protein YdhG (YjbR/CyaY superfamily)